MHSGPALLFSPADRPALIPKAAARSDVVIVDLEDAVASDRKDVAREVARQALGQLDLHRTVVRINALDSPHAAADLQMCASFPSLTVMLPKAESASSLDELHGLDVIALCETAAGVLNAPALARAENCVGLMLGAEDLVSDLGSGPSHDENGRLSPLVVHARHAVIYAAAAARVPAIDSVYVSLDDIAGLQREAAEAASLGFRAKGCIHPGHVATIRAAFRPSEDQVRAAKHVLNAAAGHSGAFRLDGQMVDEPVLVQARAILARAGDPIS